MQTLTVDLGVADTAERVRAGVAASGLSVECVGEYAHHGTGSDVVMLVFEKYFMRTSSRASLSVVVEDVAGQTRVAFCGSGGGQTTMFRFDWGAGDSFADAVAGVLRDHIVE